MARIISIISGEKGAGKTISATNLAVALTNLGKKVLLVDANFSTPRINSHLGIYNFELSLKNILNKEIHFSDAIKTHSSGLKIIPSLLNSKNSENLDLEALKETIFNLRNYSDFVILDSESNFSEKMIACLEACDETIIVANPYKNSVKKLHKTTILSRDMKKDVLGIVLNNTTKNKNSLSEHEIVSTVNAPIISSVPFDKIINKSIQLGSPAVLSYSKSKVSKEFKNLASMII